MARKKPGPKQGGRPAIHLAIKASWPDAVATALANGKPPKAVAAKKKGRRSK